MPVSRQTAIRFIVALGLISLFADVTYEGGRSVNGLFLGALGAGGAIIGIVSGAGELAGYVLRLASGIAADRTRRYWTLTVTGYILNLVAVPMLAFANHWGVAALLMILERAGKGLRTPARDVMLSQASVIVGRGWGFGLHEFMDQTGAFTGPLLVALALKHWHNYPAAYALLAIPAGLSLLALLGAIRLYPDPSRFEEPPAPHAHETGRLPRAFWIYVTAAGLLALGFVDFPLMAFHLQKAAVVPTSVIPVFYSAAMGVEAFSALLFGRLFDRIGTPALVAGVLLSAASSPLVFFGSFYPALAGMLLWGAGMGAEQSPLRAKIANLVSQEKRGSAYGIFNTVYGLAWFAGSAAIGILYARSLASAAALAVLAQLAAIPLLLMVGRKHS